MSDYKMLINGEWVESKSGKSIPVINPATGEEFARIASGGTDDVEAAVAAAQRAYPVWSQKPMMERAGALMKIAEGIRARIEDMAMLDCLDHGMPIRTARGLTMGSAFGLEHTAHESQFLEEESYNLGGRAIAYLHREPIGVCALITPWNVPLMMAINKLAPALMMGNTCIIKPPSIDSLTTLALGEVIAELSDIIPPGTVNIITGPGGTTGQALASHPVVRKVSFTGSCETGRNIMSAASDTIKRINLELGGKNPFIVLEDADLDAAVRTAVSSQHFNSGQICASPGRYYVHEKVYDEFVAKYIIGAVKLAVGDPTNEETEMGPVVSKEHRDKVDGYIRTGIDQGAVPALYQPEPLSEPFCNGYYVLPTVLTEVTQDMTIAREEIFGPVACVIRFGDEDDVIAMANDNTFGLTASVWTRDIPKGIKMAHSIESGVAWVNNHMDLGGIPFGGVKESGIGKEGGKYSFDEYCSMKAMYINLEPGVQAGMS